MTNAQRNANRLNSQASTGPRSEIGKLISSQNATKHGLYTRPEDTQEFRQFALSIGAELSPTGFVEEALVSEIAGATWRLRRCNTAEAALGDFDESTDKTRRSIERARSHALNTLTKAMTHLRRLQGKREPAPQLAPTTPAVTAADTTPNTELASFCKTDALIPRGAPCPCGSREKYKRCCGTQAPPVLNRAA